ncbi:uncharacterized protein LOC116162605 [Photinus pyralis]|uniref:uncharacterized protein LOC116162605 n=1 Tax=Photinus pyralis TaxID=7054 RepID=UPI00126739FC|nr:uncharacterized protein LOC116162605 [Photinus pyralis]
MLQNVPVFELQRACRPKPLSSSKTDMFPQNQKQSLSNLPLSLASAKLNVYCFFKILDTDGDDNADGPSPDLTQPQEQERMESQRSVSSISSANTVMPPPPAKKAKKTMLAKQNELLDRACAYLSEPNSSSSGANSLACHWAETLDRLDPTQRLYAKKAINDVLFEAELGNLHRHAVQINTATYMPYLRSPRISQHSPQPSPHSSQPSPPPPHSPQSSPYSPQPSPDSSQPSLFTDFTGN